MRFGLNNENQTFMMPKSIQKKHSMTRFIVLQVLAHQNMVVGIFDPEWGLTLPSPIHRLDEIKENIPKTLKAKLVKSGFSKVSDIINLGADELQSSLELSEVDTKKISEAIGEVLGD